MKKAVTCRMVMAPYMKREPTLTIKTLENATIDAENTMRIFNEMRESHNLAASHFDEIISSYNALMEEATASKDKNNVYMMKKATASLEIMAENLKKTNKEFDRRYKKLIIAAKKANGQEVEEDDEEEADDGDDVKDKSGTTAAPSTEPAVQKTD